MVVSEPDPEDVHQIVTAGKTVNSIQLLLMTVSCEGFSGEI